MPGVQELDGGVWNISSERFCTRRDEEWIVSAPYREQRRLRLPEIFLESRVQLDVVCIVEKQIQLNIHVTGARDHRSVKRVPPRRDNIRVWHPCCVLPFDFVGAESFPHSFTILGRWFAPIAANGSPCVA